MHGSGASGEATVYSNSEHDILLGNLGLTIVTKSLKTDGLAYPFLLRFIRNIDKSYLTEMVCKPLILVKPFELSLIPYNRLRKRSYPPDIWTFEMVKAAKILYGDDKVLQLFNTNFSYNSGFKIIINRLFGLNLCLPLIARPDFNNEVKVLIVNYECVKGILAALESLLVLMGKYCPSYSARGSLASEAVSKYSEFFNNPDDVIETFKLATELKCNPQKLSVISPVDYWFKSRLLLQKCLLIYSAQGFSIENVFTKVNKSTWPKLKIKELYKFIINGKISLSPLADDNIENTAMRLMLSCVFSMDSHSCGKSSSNIENLLLASRYANFLHTHGEWHEIMDHVKIIRNSNL